MANTTVSVTIITQSETLTLLAVSTTMALLHVPICVAAYRVSRKVNTFIILLSETLTNTVSLLVTITLTQVQYLSMGVMEADAFVRTNHLLIMFRSLLTYSSMLHNLLIAANRTFAVLFPRHYNSWWSRKVTLVATLLPWVGNAVLKGVDMRALILHNNTFPANYAFLQLYTTYAALVLYAISVLWMVVKSVMGTGREWVGVIE